MVAVSLEVLARASLSLFVTPSIPDSRGQALRVVCIPVFVADCLDLYLVYETIYSNFLPVYHRREWGLGTWGVVLFSGSGTLHC